MAEQTKKADCKCCQTKTEHVQIKSIAAGRVFWECRSCRTITNVPAASTGAS